MNVYIVVYQERNEYLTRVYKYFQKGIDGKIGLQYPEGRWRFCPGWLIDTLILMAYQSV